MWRWAVHDASDEELAESALTLDMFDPALGEGLVTRANVVAASLAGCRRALLGERREELDAFRNGFTFQGNVDLHLQLAPIPCEQVCRPGAHTLG